MDCLIQGQVNPVLVHLRSKSWVGFLDAYSTKLLDTYYMLGII